MIVAFVHCGAGLSKPQVPAIQIGPGGVLGDTNGYRARRGGDPDMAVSLLALELIEAVAAEGWPVAPGTLGENLTTLGLDPATQASGQIWRVGGAILELSRPMEPCRTLVAVVGPARLPAFQKALRGRRGWYARVLAPGIVRSGDRVAP